MLKVKCLDNNPYFQGSGVPTYTLFMRYYQATTTLPAPSATMDAVQDFLNVLKDIEETLDIYHRSFYDEFPMEEDKPNERAHPGSSKAIWSLNKLLWPIIVVRNGIRVLGTEYLPPGMLEHIEQANYVLDEALDMLNEEWEEASNIWTRDPANKLREHFKRMYEVTTTVRCILIEMERLL